MATALMITPTLEECIRAMQAEGLSPEDAALEGRKFWGHYESVGWRVGKNKMVSFKGAIVGWAARAIQSQQRFATRGAKPSEGMRMMVHQKELDRVIQRIELLQATYGQHQTWDPDDRAELSSLKARRVELNKLLGVKL